ncbi:MULTISPECIES: catalase family peroxidase [Pseudomonas]|uniref:catalase family peroxidase n=1 Tax=Pseudomonas TaxID=286 RepID=UPI0009B89827|nr:MULTISPECIES: catalase family peroxidase [Pseudomonas]MBP2839337.1 catalase family peroxidase [Pseudomonas sp. PNP]MCK2122736.1 catalase family peroxidase [Pseudomonas sp. PNPG3]QUN65196.1 catalase family peroxidase [Pseudomonas sp. JS425]
MNTPDGTLATSTFSAPELLIDSLNNVFGRHPQARASHAKGFCAEGIFVPAGDASRHVRAPLFTRASTAIVRWSVGGGNPNISDKSRSVRGLSVRLQGADETFDLLMISEPVFFAATPESFVHFLRARVPDPETKKPDPEKIRAYEARFPDGKLQPALLASHPAPASYATTPYFATHAFRFTNAQGESLWGRLQMLPSAGTEYLDAEAEAGLPDKFLEDELGSRLARGLVEFTLLIQPAAPGDSLTDPSVLWSSDGGAAIELGHLKISALAPLQTCEGLVFTPAQLPQGIESHPDDSVLKARGAAYGVSMARRQR